MTPPPTPASPSNQPVPDGRHAPKHAAPHPSVSASARVTPRAQPVDLPPIASVSAAPHSSPIAPAPISSAPQAFYPVSTPPPAFSPGYPAPEYAAPEYRAYDNPAPEFNATDAGSDFHVGSRDDDSAHDAMWRRVTLGTAAILLVISSVATTLFITHGSGSGTDNSVFIAPGPARVPTDIGSRATDPQALTTAEVFPTKALQLGRVRYDVLASQAVTQCPETVSGAAAAKLRSLNCTQLVRAAISDPGRTFLITAGILNLSSTEDVNALAEVLRSEGGGNFDMIVPTNMTVKAAQARPLHFSRNGHYLSFATGVPIKSKEGENIFENDKLSQALNITRVLTAAALERRQLGAAVGS